MIALTTIAANRMSESFIVQSDRRIRWMAALLMPLVIGPIWLLSWRTHGGQIGTLSGLVLVALLGTSAITDLYGQRIYNWATYSAIFWAFAINFVSSISDPAN